MFYTQPSSDSTRFITKDCDRPPNNLLNAIPLRKALRAALLRVKWVLVSAVVILEIGSIASACATSSAAFIVGRAIAGCSSAGILNGVLM
jgi:hypothetical protein